jgi:hypothetical protein
MVRAILSLLGFIAFAIPVCIAQAASPALPLPDAPQPQTLQHSDTSATPCPSGNATQPPADSATAVQVQNNPSSASQQTPCPPKLPKNWFARFLTGPEVKPMTPMEKAHLAARNVIDPFNTITILGSSAIAVGSDADSPYGPGMTGFGRYMGVSYTEDITGEFFGTFLIPSIVHQDPHYHRMPTATISRRVFHGITQVFWTQGDDGKGMTNYANLVGFAIDDEIGNFYVPGQQTHLSASVERYGIGLATAPVDNFITEFLPDVARRIHVRVVLVQRIINMVATTGTGASQ